MTTVLPRQVDPAEAAELCNALSAPLTGRRKDDAGQGGRAVVIPEPLVQPLLELMRLLGEGRSVTLLAGDEEMTTQAAADLLHVSRPHLIKLLDRGEIPFHKTGTHRRLKMCDVLAFQQRRADERSAALRELTSLSEEIDGGYR